MSLSRSFNVEESTGLSEYVSDPVIGFYGTGRVTALEAEYKFKDHWKNQGAYSKIIYREEDLEVNPSDRGFIVQGNILETVTKGAYDIPMIVKSRITYGLDRNGKIESFQGDKLATFYDVYEMFDLDPEITYEDLQLRNRPDDWEKIFKKLEAVAYNSKTAAEDYRRAVLELYGNDNIVNYDNSFVYLKDFLPKIIDGDVKVSYVSEVGKAEGPGKLITVVSKR